MDIDGFCYEWQYNSFPIDLINLKFTGCTHGVVVNIYTNFEVIWTKSNFMSNLRYLIYNILSFCGPEIVKSYSANYFGLGLHKIYKENDTMVL